MSADMNIVCLSKYLDDGRVYFRKDLAEEMGISKGNKVTFKIDVENGVELLNGDGEGVTEEIKSQNRLSLPQEVVDKLSLEPEDKVVVLKESREEGDRYTMLKAIGD